MLSLVEAGTSPRLIPLSQVDQYLGLDASYRVPVAVLRRRGPRCTVVTPSPYHM